jgi:DNA-binding XRE family transcriptional regulator
LKTFGTTGLCQPEKIWHAWHNGVHLAAVLELGRRIARGRIFTGRGERFSLSAFCGVGGEKWGAAAARPWRPAPPARSTWLLLLICRFLSSATGIVAGMAVSENDINVIAGKNIRAVREKMGLSQDAFADVCQVHRTYIGSVERGERNITLNTLAMIAKAAKTTPIALLTAKGRRK